MKNILIIQPIDKSGIEILENRPDYNFEIIDGTDLEQIKEKIVKCDGISIRTAKLPADVIRSAKNLKIISRHGVGYDNIDLAAAKEKKITISITATANAVAVAEHVMFMLLNISKRKDMYDKTVKSGRFNDRNKLPKTIEPVSYTHLTLPTNREV